MITLMLWVLALGVKMWGEVQIVRAEREAEIAELRYAQARVRMRIAEVEAFNRGLDMHIENLQESYPRVVKTRQDTHYGF